MKAQRILFDDFGGPEVMYVADIELPEIKDNELILKIMAAGINPVDTKLRRGQSFLCSLIKEPKPWSLDSDVAGIVIKAGSKAAFKEGDVVTGLVGHRVYPCAYSTHVITDGARLVKLDNDTRLDEAASLLTAGITAYNIASMIVDDIQTRSLDVKDSKVLVTGATGGVGHILLQLLIHFGLSVSSLSQNKEDAFLKSLALDGRLSYLDENNESFESFDYVVDNIGFDTGLAFFNYLKTDGLLITVPTITADFIKEHTPCDKRSASVLSHSDNALIKKLMDMLYANKLKVNISGRYALQDIAKAHSQIESCHTKGKIVLLPNGLCS